MKHILKCTKCGGYTMQQVHSCGGEALNVKPAKWNPEDRFGKYRRMAKNLEP